MMMTSLSDFAVLGSAFVFGIFSSLHCSVMCGPLVGLSVQLHAKKHSGNLIYQLGRLLSYLLFGLALATLGHGANSLSGFQNQFQLAPILGMILFLVFGVNLFRSEFSKTTPTKNRFLTRMNAVLGNLTTALYKSKNPALISFGLGLMSGILPCGVLYPAYALAFSMASLNLSLLVVFCFFLGTLPLLYGAGFGIQSIRSWIQPRYLPWMGIVVLSFALFVGSNRFQMKGGENCERPPTPTLSK